MKERERSENDSKIGWLGGKAASHGVDSRIYGQEGEWKCNLRWTLYRCPAFPCIMRNGCRDCKAQAQPPGDDTSLVFICLYFYSFCSNAN